MICDLWLRLTKVFATPFKASLKAQCGEPTLMCSVLLLQDNTSDTMSGDKRGNNLMMFHLVSLSLSYITHTFLKLK